MTGTATARAAGLFTDEHDALRESAARFFARAVPAETYEQWAREDGVPAAFFAAAAEHDFVALAVPEEHGGSGVTDPRFGAVLVEQAMHAALPAVALALGQHNDVCVPALVAHGCPSEELAALAEGRLLTALVCAEGPAPVARATGDGWVLDGSCPAVLGGGHADVMLVVAAADTGQAAFRVDARAAGVARLPGAVRFGLQASDFADVMLAEVQVAAGGRLADGAVEALAVAQRLTLAVAAVAGARAALGWTVQYVHERKAFGRPLASFENTRMSLGDIGAELAATGAFVDACMAAHAAGDLGPARAAAAKLCATELQARAVDAGVQLHGGYGYMTEYPIARAYADARMLRVFGGSSEVLRAVVAADAGV